MDRGSNRCWQKFKKTGIQTLGIAPVFLAISMFDPVSAKPQRIVSINLCTDQLLMLLAERGRIASVSYLAANRNASAMATEAIGLWKNHGLAEEILMMKPDLVLAGAFTSRPTVFLLKRLGFNIVKLPVVSNIEDIRRNIRTVADAVGETRRGRQLIDTFDRRLLAASASTTQPKPVAAIYRRNSFTSGDNTLTGAILEAAGLTNLAAQLGISGTGHLPLEVLISQQPDIIVMSRERNRKRSVATTTLRHPAFKKSAANRLTVRIADYIWACGTPFVVEAIEYLSLIRQKWQARAAFTEQIR